ncbi:MAG: flagellar motor protein MotB [Chloroflexi bacterium]|nr:flagellar motor protein MotB [Chloroflexota bacterium]
MAKKHGGDHGGGGGHDGGGSLRWLLTYADMITLLMVFFIVLYSMANTDLKRFAQVAVSLQKAFNQGKSTAVLPGSGNPLGEGATPERDLSVQNFDVVPLRNRQFFAVSTQLSEVARTAGVEGQLDVELTYEGMVVTLSEALLFDSASAELQPGARQTLMKVADVLRPLGNPLRVQAHTDDFSSNSPAFATNWELSSARAVAIARYLAEQANIAPQRLSADAFGQFRPRVANDTASHRAMNRRAEIVVLYAEEGRLSDPPPATPVPTSTPAKGTP